MAQRRKLAAAVADDLAARAALEADATIARQRSEIAAWKNRYQAALRQLELEQRRADAIAAAAGAAAGPRRKHRPPAKAKPAGEATALLLLSDWHCEERVEGETVGRGPDGRWLNEYDLDVCDRRLAELAQRFAAMLEHERRLVAIRRVVVWLGGDFLTGAIHPDCAELAQLSPLAALRFAGERIRGILDHVATLADDVLVVTNSGNHGRNTPDLRIGTEAANSLETHLYTGLAAAERNPRITWNVGQAYLNTVEILPGFRVRFHHGHAVRYSGGGVGGITIPINKSIAAWDRIEPVQLTVQGHYHQFQWLRSSRYICNASLIGHSAYATMVKAAFEPPSQTLAIVSHERNDVTRAYPLFVDGDLRRRRA